MAGFGLFLAVLARTLIGTSHTVSQHLYFFNLQYGRHPLHIPVSLNVVWLEFLNSSESPREVSADFIDESQSECCYRGLVQTSQINTSGQPVDRISMTLSSLWEIGGLPRQLGFARNCKKSLHPPKHPSKATETKNSLKTKG